MGVDNPLSDWVPESVWGSVQALKELEDYASLPDDLVGSSKRWREWMELERPGGAKAAVVCAQWGPATRACWQQHLLCPSPAMTATGQLVTLLDYTPSYNLP